MKPRGTFFHPQQHSLLRRRRRRRRLRRRRRRRRRLRPRHAHPAPFGIDLVPTAVRPPSRKPIAVSPPPHHPLLVLLSLSSLSPPWCTVQISSTKTDVFVAHARACDSFRFSSSSPLSLRSPLLIGILVSSHPTLSFRLIYQCNVRCRISESLGAESFLPFREIAARGSIPQ